MPRLRRLLDPGPDEEGAADAGHPAARRSCSSRASAAPAAFPYYMNTYGIHSIHGRAPAVATGLEGRPARSVGVGHHRRRRRAVDRRQPPDARHPPQPRPQHHAVQQPHLRPDQGAVLADLAAGQGDQEHARSASIDNPLHPLSIAIGCEATFVARSIDVNIKHLGDGAQARRRARGHVVRRGLPELQRLQRRRLRLRHRHATRRPTTTLDLEHGKPLIFGKNRDKGIRLNGMEPEVVELGKGITEDDLLFHDEKAARAEPGLPAQPHAPPGVPRADRRVPRRRRARATTSCSNEQIDRRRKKQRQRRLADAVQQRRHLGRGSDARTFRSRGIEVRQGLGVRYRVDGRLDLRRRRLKLVSTGIGYAKPSGRSPAARRLKSG